VKTLLIMRHAKSDYPPDVSSDFERPLNARGLGDLPRVGALLRQYGPLPEYILSSSAVRARQTATGIAEHLDLPTDHLTFDEALYLAPADVLQRMLHALPEDLKTALLIAHNPGLEQLVYVLSGARIALPTAGLVALELYADSWRQLAPRESRLLYFVVPRLIKSLTS